MFEIRHCESPASSPLAEGKTLRSACRGSNAGLSVSEGGGVATERSESCDRIPSGLPLPIVKCNLLVNSRVLECN